MLHLVFRAYQDQAVPAADSRSDQVQSTLASWPEEARDWWELDQSLAKLDYRLAVEQNHQVVYSSLNRFQEDLYNRIFANASWPESGTLSLQDQGVFIVGRRCGDAVLVAMMEPQTPEMFGQQRPQNEAALISFSVIGLAAIAIIGVLSFLFTQYQVRRILKPVNAIIQAAGRVERGDLSTPWTARGWDEFSSVYAAFEHMRRHLLEEPRKTPAMSRPAPIWWRASPRPAHPPHLGEGYLKGMRDGVANTPEKREQYWRWHTGSPVRWSACFSGCSTSPSWRPETFRCFSATPIWGTLWPSLSGRPGRSWPPEGPGGAAGAPAPHPVRIDPEQLLRVLNNLKDNAVRYSGASPLVLTLTVWRQRDRECIRFADNGQGVPEDQLPHLFEQFWRGDQARSSRAARAAAWGCISSSILSRPTGARFRQETTTGWCLKSPCPVRRWNKWPKS